VSGAGYGGSDCDVVGRSQRATKLYKNENLPINTKNGVLNHAVAYVYENPA
jgi:hypothetical protein